MSGALRTDTLLGRAPTITLELHSAGNATATVNSRRVEVGARALEVLVAAADPIHLKDLVERLPAAGTQDFVNVVATVRDLVSSGLLEVLGESQDEAPAQIVDVGGQWTDPSIHVAMLDDEARTSAYVAAVRRVVQPDDVVLDLGSGTGVLAVAAALAGARRAYAIEASAMARVARELAASNGVEDRVVVLQSWSTRVTLATRANVLVTETIGNDPFAEHILENVLDARRRLLTADARIIPASLAVHAVLVDIPDAVLEKHAFLQANALRWTADYGIDFSVLDAIRSRSSFAIELDQSELSSTAELGEPVEVARVDFREFASKPADRVVIAETNRAGRLVGAVTFFEAELAPGIHLSTRPSRAKPTNHWRATLWLLERPREVEAGRRVSLDFRFDGAFSSLRIEP
ncbi:MAG: 50S ribosomal protein L11 methyltransferase [Polyangiaceae bacterium]